MTILKIFATLSVLVFSAMAVFEAPPPDPSATAMGDIPPAIGPGPTSLFYNGGITAGGGYRRSFGHADFDQLSAWAGWQNDKVGRLSAVFGSCAAGDLSSETSVSLGFTRSIFSDIHTELNLALRGDYFSLSYGNSLGGVDLGSSGSFGLSLAGEAIVYKRTKIALIAENLTATNLGVEGDIELPRAVSAAIGYSPYNSTEMAFHLRRETGAEFVYGLGVAFSPHEIVIFRLGAATNPDRVTAGFGLKYRFARFDYALKSHPALPLTHSASIGIDLER